MYGTGSRDGYVDILPGIKIKTLNHGEKMLMSEFLLEKGSRLPEHSHVYEQSGYLVKGRILLHIAARAQELRNGDSWNIPGNTKHSAEILEDSIVIEIFSPARDDYLGYVNSGDII